MSGNSTRLGVGAARIAIDAATAAGLIGAFLIGVTGGSLLGHVAKAKRVTVVLGIIGLLLSLATTLGNAGLLHAALGLTAFAMGAENAIFEQQGQVRVGLTYMTGSLVKIGQGVAGMIIGRNGWEWTAYLLLWGGFVIGAVLAAALYPFLQLDSLWPASIAAIIMASLAGRIDTTG